ncbi:MAG TPA: hypothetical protein VFG69_11565 [Nannocystaceae bacterium]|nr:hypothetical protein [Nannocystaceae bacterium]
MTSLPFASPIRFALVTTALFAPACNNGPTDGSLSVEYALGLNGTCEQFSVQTIRVTLDEGKYEEEEACDPASPVVFTGVAAGNYDVLVEGIDAEGFTVMDNIGGDTKDDKVEVVGGSDVTHDVRLGESPAQVQVRWLKFVEGEPSECAFIATKYFAVSAYHGATSFFAPHEFGCSVPPGYQTLPDEGRVIDGETLDGVLVQVLDESHEQIGDDLVFNFTPPGAGRAVQIDITCDGPEGSPTCMGEVVGIDAAEDSGEGSGGADESGTG